MTTYKFENEAHEKGISFVCGVDEAGRGPLAGPVFASAVILPDGLEKAGIDDSKKMSPKKRSQLSEFIKENAISYGIAFADEREIDELNILNATFLAMRRAIDKLEPKPGLVLVDGNRVPKSGNKEISVIKGDSLCISIAAASVLAKVARDEFMVRLAEQYPEYMFEKHKGYPTALHYELIRRHGPCPAHRVTFLKNFNEKHAK